MKIPFVNLASQFSSLKDELMEDFSRVGEAGIYILGDDVHKFEESIKAYCGVKHAIGVGNGSDALFMCIKGLGIGSGDEVILPTNSFIATAWTVVAAGATPVLADIRSDLNIDPKSVRDLISPNTKAIIPVHFAGRAAAMNEINAIAEENDLLVIEDAAQAIGARYYGRKVGSLGIAAAFSLHPLKNLGIYGDGGLITTNNDKLAEAVLLLRNHGLINRNQCDVWGYNSRLDTLQAAFALTKLKYLDGWTDRCRSIAKMYRDGLQNYVEVPYDKDWEFNVYHNFIISTPLRDKLKLYLESVGIGSAIHYPIPIHLQPAAKDLGYVLGSLPIAESHALSMLSLPIYPQLEDSEVNTIIFEIKTFVTAIKSAEASAKLFNFSTKERQ